MKAIFLDRDGVINEMIHVPEHDFVDSPVKPSQFKLIDGVKKAIKILQKLDYKIIIISNQPGIAKGYYTKKTFDKIQEKMHLEFHRSKIIIDDEFYCLHHPNAKLKEYRKKCKCRKPGIDLILQAKKKYELDMKLSYFIGDGVVDMQAAKIAGCNSIFIGNINSTITNLFNSKKCFPDHIFHNLLEASKFLESK